MTARIIDGDVVASDVRAEVASAVEGLCASGRQKPTLAALLVGNDPASETYVRLKRRDCAEVGITSVLVRLPATASEEQILSVVQDLNADESIDGVIVQKPLPESVDAVLIDSVLAPSKDVDGTGPTNLGLLVRGYPSFIPATPAGIQQLLVRSKIDIQGMQVVIVGRSILVGRPLALVLSAKNEGANATVTLVHTGTSDLRSITRQADILVTAAGQLNLITAGMIQPGAVVIDVGMNRIDDASKRTGYRLSGDVDFEAVKEVAGAITPVPGGVGPMTRAMLLVNTLKAAQV